MRSSYVLQTVSTISESSIQHVSNSPQNNLVHTKRPLDTLNLFRLLMWRRHRRSSRCWASLRIEFFLTLNAANHETRSESYSSNALLTLHGFAVDPTDCLHSSGRIYLPCQDPLPGHGEFRVETPRLSANLSRVSVVTFRSGHVRHGKNWVIELVLEVFGAFILPTCMFPESHRIVITIFRSIPIPARRLLTSIFDLIV